MVVKVDGLVIYLHELYHLSTTSATVHRGILLNMRCLINMRSPFNMMGIILM